ncbi:MAG: T9SS type A sorting domain-containing protein [Flavobacteriales bacterium]|nr:T9SS type A sorting domain-containing protein [Flavobacteriales bacterium]
MTMFHRYFAISVVFFFVNAFSQHVGDRNVVLEEVTIPDMPGIHSFAWGQHNGEWLLIGGRTDGLHQRQPFAAFLASGNNTMGHVLNPFTNEVWSADLSSLPTALFEQLQSTNLEFFQRGNTLYIIGGYGFSPTANDHITHGQLAAVDVPNAISAIKNGTSPNAFFRQTADDRMAVTGGYLGLLNNEFYLVGGQRFIGRYNPMGPDHGPGFIQEYTNAIRRFGIDDDGSSMNIIGFTETIDTLELHRRDYNLVPQIFPNGEQGFTAFSGVFQYGSNIPWLNTVDITSSGYTVAPVFEQLLNQYHTAHMPVYSTNDNVMSTVFFGGIGRYYFDMNGQLLDDTNVPFVNTISRIQRNASGAMSEAAIGTMPALLGAGAEFIPTPYNPIMFDNVIDLDQLSGDTVLAGHIIGGIESSAANVFFINTGTQSAASTRVFKVLLVRDVNAGIIDQEKEPLSVTVALNNDGTQLQINVDLLSNGVVEMNILDSTGKLVRAVLSARVPSGPQQFIENVKDLTAGVYFLDLVQGDQRSTVRFIR